MRKVGIVGIVAGALLLASCGSGQQAATPTPAATTPEPDPVALSFLPAEFRATGTEPFWSIAVTKTQLTYTTPENQAGVTVPVIRQDGAENALFTATIAGQPLQLLITPGACSDGMSDKTYPWTVEKTLGEDSVEGCAEPLPAESEAPAKP